MGFLGDLTYYFLKVILLGQSEKIAQYIALKLGYSDCACNDRRNKMNNWLLPEHKKTYRL
jgi:hypothetical protein